MADEQISEARITFRDKESHYIVIKESICQENMIVLNVYGPNNRASKYMRQKLTECQGEIDKSTIIVGDFNIPLSVTDRSRRQRKTQYC